MEKTSTSTCKNKWHFGLCAIIKWKLCKNIVASTKNAGLPVEQTGEGGI